MNDIRTILRIAARRLELGSFLSVANIAAIALGVLVVLLLVIERAGASTFLPWVWLGPLMVAAALLASLHVWSRRRRSELQVALEVDERLALREKLSTALHCSDRTDPFAQAAVEDAVTTARDPKVREKVKRYFSVPSPHRWWMSPLIVLLAVALWFVEPMNLFADEVPEDDAALTDSKQRRDAAIEAIVEPIERSPELREELSDLLDDLAKPTADTDALKTREEVQRDAIKKLTDLNKRLDEILNGPKGKTAESMERTLEQLKVPKDGPAKELAEAMSKGDFKAAQEALAKLMEDAQNGKLNDEQKKQLAEQLADIAKQLQQLAQQQQQLEGALQQAGLNPQLAQNPQALQQAIQNNPNLNEQQKQQLQQMAQAQQAAQQMCQGLGQGMQQMAQGLMQGQMGQMGQAGQKMGEQLNQLEAMQQLLQQAQAAANACQGGAQGLGQGLAMQQAMQQWAQQQGGAFGNRGQGAGGKAPIAPTPSGTQMVKSPTQLGQGDIIARQFIDGPVFVGESHAQMRKVAGAISEGYDEAQSDEQVPPKYWEAHMHYFGELKQRVEAVQRSDNGEAAESAPAEIDSDSGE